MFGQVPEGFELVWVMLTFLISLGIMVALGRWWEH